jgi:hypothetical protein
MKNINFKPEKLKVLEKFVNEVSDELNVEFNNEIIDFTRMTLNGKKMKLQKFISPIFYYQSNEFELSFIPFSESSVELWKINVKNRGKGIGSEIMSRIMDVSDRTGIKIKLVPVDYDCDETNQNGYLIRLKSWYTIGLGFVKPRISFDPFYTYYPVNEYKMVG